MSTFIKGDNLILSIHNGSTYDPIGCLTSNSMSFSVNAIEAQTKCDAGQIKREAGSTSYEVSFDAIYIATEAGKTDYDALLQFVNQANGSNVTWKLSTGQSSPTDYFGEGVFSELTLDAPTGDEYATFSGTISGSGLVVTTDPKV